jgi:hypothetical protein
MKQQRRVPVALTLSTKRCQRPLCLDFGRLRVSRRISSIRTLYLCDHCLESMLPIHVNDLFLKFGTPLESDRDKIGEQF